MECLITHAWPAWPPKPTNTIIMPPNGKEQYHTYAGHLWQPYYQHVDRDMVSLIMRMQAHLPADRPTLQQLEPYVTSKMRASGTGDRTEGELLQWLQKVIYEPPPPSEEVTQMDQVEKQIIGVWSTLPPPLFLPPKKSHPHHRVPFSDLFLLLHISSKTQSDTTGFTDILW